MIIQSTSVSAEMISALVRARRHINTCAPSFLQEAEIMASCDEGSDVRKENNEYENCDFRWIY